MCSDIGFVWLGVFLLERRVSSVVEDGEFGGRRQRDQIIASPYIGKAGVDY